jgi:hypothetical protein
MQNQAATTPGFITSVTRCRRRVKPGISGAALGSISLSADPLQPLLPLWQRRFRYPGRKPLDARKVLQGTTLTGGNRNDVTQLLELLDRVPPVRGRVGRPRTTAAAASSSAPTAATTSTKPSSPSAGASSAGGGWRRHLSQDY